MNEYTAENGKFKKGNPGKPKGAIHWQTRTLEEVAKVVKKQKNLKALGKHFQELFDKNPAGFFLKFVMPFLPKNLNIDMNMTGDITFRAWLKKQIETEQENEQADE